MKSGIALGFVALAACGNKPEPKAQEKVAGSGAAAPVGERFGKVKQPSVSPLCKAAREGLGYGAECIETELPQLTSSAGKVTRFSRKGDPTATWIFVLTRPDGSFTPGGSSATLGEILKAFDVRAADPALLANLLATLNTEAAVARCVDKSDKLPDRGGKPMACKAPTLEKIGDDTVLTYFVEQFPQPRLMNRTRHTLWLVKTKVSEHGFSSTEGEGFGDLPDAPVPAAVPTLPSMTTPPAWVAKPVPAADDVSKALCAEITEKVFDRKGRACKAYAYPSLDTPAGSVFYLANDWGERNEIALAKPDGTLVTGSEVTGTQSPMNVLVKSYDPRAVSAEQLAALHLFLAGEPSHILCLPGGSDVIPDAKCAPPTAAKVGDNLVLSFILEELPLPNAHGSVSNPGVRSTTVTLTPEGGASSEGLRLVDQRDE